MEALKDSLYEIVRANQPATARQAYYLAVSAGVVEKTEQAYKNDVIRVLGQMRLEGEMPFDWLVDNTRLMRKPMSYSSVEHALRSTATFYRRDLWRTADTYVEIWAEKDAISGVLFDVTEEYDVPLMINRGFGSLTFLHAAAMTIEAKAKPTFIYYFGDWDPSGVSAGENLEQRLHDFAPHSEIHFERVAVNREQIVELSLPTRPTKKSDSRSRNFTGESVEVDAIPPYWLRQLTRDCIESHIDDRALAVLLTVEREERDLLMRMAAGQVA